MAKIAKRLKEIRAAVDKTKQYDVKAGFELLKSTAKAKFVESVDVSIQLGIDATKSDQNVRGATVLPHGTGKTVRVLVFTQGELADQAKAAGADFVGMDELSASVLQSAARIICPPLEDKFHTCSLRSIFCQVHAPAENDSHLICDLRRKLCEALGTA